MATIERSAFVPNLFTLPGAQILTVQPAYRDMTTDPHLGVPRIRQFIAAAQDPVTARAQGSRWVDWEKHFNYLCVLYTRTDDPNPLPQTLEALVAGYQFQLYRIKQSDD